MQPKKQLKVHYIGIFEEILFLLTKKALLEKVPKIRAWVDPPPSFGQCPNENVFFSIEAFPYHGYSMFAFLWRGLLKLKSVPTSLSIFLLTPISLI